MTDKYKKCRVLYEEVKCLEHDSIVINDKWISNTSDYCNVYVEEMHKEIHNQIEANSECFGPIEKWCIYCNGGVRC